MKAVRELGLIRRKTVWILSLLGVENCGGRILVREDRIRQTPDGPVVSPEAPLGSYVWGQQPLKASQAGNPSPKHVFHIVEDDYAIGGMYTHSNMVAYPY